MTSSALAVEQMLGSDWRQSVERRRSEIVARVRGRTDVILFGTGYLGRQVLKDLEHLPYRPVAFVDNNEALWGSQVEGFEVLRPDDAVARFGDNVLWLITVYTNSRVIAQCRGLGVRWLTCAELSWILPEPHPSNFIFGVPERLAESAPEIGRAASIWADDESEAEYLSQLRWRFLLDYASLAAPRSAHEIYFPAELVRVIADEVYVDCGAFTGDTIAVFLANRGGRFKEIVGIEPDAISRIELQDRVDDWRVAGIGPITVEPYAAGLKRDKVRFGATGTIGSTVGSGTDLIDIAPLDEILGVRKPTYIKFDVEGAEGDALIGGSQTIRANLPVLAVSLYHKPADLWELPLLIRSLSSDYRLYLRRYSDERWETVCYAVPESRVVG